MNWSIKMDEVPLMGGTGDVTYYDECVMYIHYDTNIMLLYK